MNNEQINNLVAAFAQLEDVIRNPAIHAETLACELVRIPTVTPASGEIFELCQNILEELGFVCELFEHDYPDGQPCTSLVATIGEGAPHTAISGHLDVVPARNDYEWTLTQGKPFAAELVTDEDGQNVIVGRGILDMKGPIAASIAAMAETIAIHSENGRDLPCTFSFILTGDEETGGRFGTGKTLEKLAEKNVHFDQCIVPEPSSRKNHCDEAKIGMRGSLALTVDFPGELPQNAGNTTVTMTLTGLQGHTGHAGDSVNPLWHAARLINVLCNPEKPVMAGDIAAVMVPVVLDSDSGARNVSPETASLILETTLPFTEDVATNRTLVETFEKALTERFAEAKSTRTQHNTELTVSVDYDSTATPQSPQTPNPLIAAAKAVAALELPVCGPNAHFPVSPSEAVITRFVKNSCAFHLRFNDSLSPEDTGKKAVDRLLGALDDPAQANPHVEILSKVFYSEPSGFVNDVCDSIKSVTGRDVNLVTSGGASDMKYFKCPSIEVGPKDFSIHAVNERVKPDTLVELQHIYARVFGDICRKAQARKSDIREKDLSRDLTDTLARIRKELGIPNAMMDHNVLFLRLIQDLPNQPTPETLKTQIFAINRNDDDLPIFDEEIESAITGYTNALDDGQKIEILNIPRITGGRIIGTGNYWSIDKPNEKIKMSRFLRQYTIGTVKE